MLIRDSGACLRSLLTKTYTPLPAHASCLAGSDRPLLAAHVYRDNIDNSHARNALCRRVQTK